MLDMKAETRFLFRIAFKSVRYDCGLVPFLIFPVSKSILQGNQLHSCITFPLDSLPTGQGPSLYPLTYSLYLSDQSTERLGSKMISWCQVTVLAAVKGRLEARTGAEAVAARENVKGAIQGLSQTQAENIEVGCSRLLTAVPFSVNLSQVRATLLADDRVLDMGHVERLCSQSLKT